MNIEADHLAEAIGQRIYEGKHIVGQVADDLKGCKTDAAIINKAIQQRSAAVRAGSYLRALCYDEVLRMKGYEEA